MIDIEPHFYCVVASSNMSSQILDILPECDLVEELRHVINTQLDILLHMIEGKPYGKAHINAFLDYIDEINYEVLRLVEEE